MLTSFHARLRAFLLLLPLCALLAASCTESIDQGSRYVFRDRTVMDYLRAHAQYSEYTRLLGQVTVSGRSASTMAQLLAARGNYTVFAPTDDAVRAYLRQLADTGLIAAPRWDAFTDSALLDSVRRVVVHNSIIDGGDNERYETGNFPRTSNGEFDRANMCDHRLSVYYGDAPDSVYINRDCPVHPLNRDIQATNGVIHQVGKVIAPEENTLADILMDYLKGRKRGFLVMARLCQACGLLDTLSRERDETYERLYLLGRIEERTPARGLATMDGGYSYAPEHRKYGFTLFAEPDAFWEAELGKPAAAITPADVQGWVERQGCYPESEASADYTSPRNTLYQWTTYHALPFKLAPTRLVFHYNEKGYDYAGSPSVLTIPVMEYYVTMGPRRLLKVYESAESGGVCLNRFPRVDNSRRGTGRETGCDPDRAGCRVASGDSSLSERTAVNGYIYAIDKPLAYDRATRDRLAATRIRMDCMSFFPEVMNNDIRRVPLEDARHQWVHFPDDTEYKYLGNLSINEGSTFVYYNAYGYKFGSLCGDEVKCVGHWELTFTLPPVPKRGTYEVRYRILATSERGVAQFFFGDDPRRLPPTGIPVNLTLGGKDPASGWTPDEPDDEEASAQSDKTMRSNGFMKGEESILILKNPGTTARGNANRNIVRRILTRQTLDPDKTYYLKIKAVLDSETSEFYMDHLEYCPKEVYDNPAEPEDIW